MLRLTRRQGWLALIVTVVLAGLLVLLAWLASSEPEQSPFFYGF
jgi:hypothetical protein